MLNFYLINKYFKNIYIFILIKKIKSSAVQYNFGFIIFYLDLIHLFMLG